MRFDATSPADIQPNRVYQGVSHGQTIRRRVVDVIREHWPWGLEETVRYRVVGIDPCHGVQVASLRAFVAWADRDTTDEGSKA